MVKRTLQVAGGAVVVSVIGVATLFGGPVRAQQPVVPASPDAPSTEYVVVPEPGSEEPLQLENVPLGLRYTALQAARQYVRNPQFKTAAFDTGGDLAAYELAGTGANNVTFEVDVSPDNTVEEVEVTIKASDVPRAVNDALRAYFPNAKPTAIERSYRPLKNGVTVVYYEFNLDTGSGQDVDVEVRSDGTQILIDRSVA